MYTYYFLIENVAPYHIKAVNRATFPPHINKHARTYTDTHKQKHTHTNTHTHARTHTHTHTLTHTTHTHTDTSTHTNKHTLRYKFMVCLRFNTEIVLQEIST